MSGDRLVPFFKTHLFCLKQRRMNLFLSEMQECRMIEEDTQDRNLFSHQSHQTHRLWKSSFLGYFYLIGPKSISSSSSILPVSLSAFSPLAASSSTVFPTFQTVFELKLRFPFTRPLSALCCDKEVKYKQLQGVEGGSGGEGVNTFFCGALLLPHS